MTCRGRQAHCSDYEMYANSKVKLFMLTAELQRRLHAAGSTTDVFSVHPGEVTRLRLQSPPTMHEAMLEHQPLCSFQICSWGFIYGILAPAGLRCMMCCLRSMIQIVQLLGEPSTFWRNTCMDSVTDCCSRLQTVLQQHVSRSSVTILVLTWLHA